MGIEIDTSTLIKISAAFCVGIIIYGAILFFLKKVGKNPKYLIPVTLMHQIKIPLAILMLSILSKYLFSVLSASGIIKEIAEVFYKIFTVISITWLVISFIRSIIRKIVAKQNLGVADNLKARKIFTQLNILERVLTFIIILIGIGILLMSFDSIRQVGISVLTSAGIAGIIIGFAAQKALSTLLAGIQIAFTQPIRLDDVVIVEGEWGTIEEINLTYVVVKIWDKRRLVVPTTYFIEKPFQNWTRNSADILGTVFIYADYRVPIDQLRQAQSNILKNTSLWDGQVDIIQVTNTQKDIIELRSLVSAKDSPTAWDLRVHLREKLINYLQESFPDALPVNNVRFNPSKDFFNKI